MHENRIIGTIAAVSMTASLLAACGGGGGGLSTGGGTSSSSSSSSSSASVVDSVDVPASYSLVWNDEFSTDGLPDSTKWSDDTDGNAFGNYNNELEYYSHQRLENAHINSGTLFITARKEDLTGAGYGYSGQHYSSARLITKDKASWTYGYYEIRAKLPRGTGTWPAIWMLGPNHAWPAGGEIDLMEYVGKEPHNIYGTIHTQSLAGTSGDGSVTALSDECTAFHRYELLWTPDSLKIGIDGAWYHTYTNAHTGHDQWPFDEPQYMLLNFAVGGDWGGPTVDDSIFPTSMEVDYVRVYQKP